MIQRRAVITGMGLVSPAGQTVDAFWDALVTGRSPITRIPDDLRGSLPCYAAGIVADFEMPAARTPGYRRPKGRLPRFVQFALASAIDAVGSSGLDLESSNPARLGVVIGNGSGGFPYTMPHLETYREKGWSRVDPQMLVQFIPNVATGHIANAFRARGYNATLVAACASGTQAVGEAMRAVRQGFCDAVIAGGTEAWITEPGLISFTILGALTRWDGDPTLASRPFDKTRDGFVPSEGAAMFVIEELEHARSRGANILAEIAGYGCTNDAFHLVAPDPDATGSSECIGLALADAGITAADIDYVNAHGTATVRGDAAETQALKRALGEHAYRVPISATKSLLGHSMGASGALEVAASVQTLRTGVIHPTINLNTPDPACDLDYVPHNAREAKVRTVLKPSFGFGGHNACLVMRALD
jgi:3-oxoacyl-[acyl-carrier-protein] synthase II